MKSPKIRFKGYTDDWEERKLGEVGKCQSGIGFPDNEQGGKVGIPFYKVSDMNNYGNEHEMTNANNYVTNEQLKRKNWKPIEEVPAIIFAKVGAAIMLNRKRLCRVPFLLDNNMMTYKFDKNWDTNFGKTLFEKINLTSLVQIGALPSYNATDIESMDISMPKSKEEQQKIGRLFTHLDKFIILHQRKCEETRTLKKYMLQKIFPQNGMNVPEIRFDRFTDTWEQRKLNDIAKFSKGSGYSKGDLEDTGTPIILYGRLYTKYEISIKNIDTFVTPKKGSVYSKGGEVIIPASGETAKDIARAATVENAGVLLGGDLNIVKPDSDINSVFLALSISNGALQKELVKKAQGKSVVHIHNEEIKALIIPCPSKSEQDRIANYFSNLDHLITLHQQKCNELQNIKKFMLQNMFV